MREVTMYELDGELAEQLPARELMGLYCGRRSGTTQTNVAYQSNGNQVQVAKGALAGNFGANLGNNSNIGSFFGNTGIQQGNFAG